MRRITYEIYGVKSLKQSQLAKERFVLKYLLVNILRSISRHQIDLLCAITIMAQGSVVLQTIARAILVNWLMGNILRGVWGPHSVYDLHASGQRLPRIVRCLPPASTL